MIFLPSGESKLMWRTFEAAPLFPPLGFNGFLYAFAESPRALSLGFPVFFILVASY